MPDLFARPLDPDGKPTGPMQPLGTVKHVRVSRPREHDATRTYEVDAYTRPDWLGRSECSFTIKPGDEARVMSLFHGGPAWLWTAWLDSHGPAPVSHGTAWQTGAYAACQHQLTGPPEPPPRPQWFLDLLVLQMQRAYAEHPELFDPRAWTTGDWHTDLTASQLAEQPTRPAIRLYDRNWSYAIDAPGVYAPPRTVARDYPPPAEPCDDCVAATAPDWLRWVQLMITPRMPQPPRTDFMPRYPGR